MFPWTAKGWRVPSHQVLVMSFRLRHQEDPDILHMIERKLVSKKLETLPPSPTHVAPAVGINLEVPPGARKDHGKLAKRQERTAMNTKKHRQGSVIYVYIYKYIYSIYI